LNSDNVAARPAAVSTAEYPDQNPGGNQRNDQRPKAAEARRKERNHSSLLSGNTVAFLMSGQQVTN